MTNLTPPRLALGDDERDAIEDCLAWYALRGEDPMYQGEFERRYTTEFCRQMGGGFADSVATGTSALFIALRALSLPPHSEVFVSPITDPGTLSAIILNGLVPRIVDSAEGSFNMGWELMEAMDRNPRAKAILLVHALGRMARDAVWLALWKGLLLIEDCSQSHGALLYERPVGTFGAIAAFSTMSRKAHITGGSGGVVYTRDEHLHHLALAHADRGKERWQPGFNDRDPRTFAFPALNFHTDELSCAIGLASLRRLEDTRQRRLAFLRALTDEMAEREITILAPSHWSPNDSPFVFPLWVRKGVDKRKLGEQLRQRGIGLNYDYDAYLVESWPWLQRYLPKDQAPTPNARTALATSLMLYLNENYTADTARGIVDVFAQTEMEWR